MRHIVAGICCCLLVVIIVGCAMIPLTPLQPEVPEVPQVATSKLFDPNVYNRIGIYVIVRTSYPLQEGDVRQVEDEFMRAVIEKGYILADRSDIEQIKRELNLQASDFTEEALARKAKALNVSAILLVGINDVFTYQYQPIIEIEVRSAYGPPPRHFMGCASISARLISAELAQVVWVSSFKGRHKVSDKERGGEALAPVARIVASGLPTR